MSYQSESESASRHCYTCGRRLRGSWCGACDYGEGAEYMHPEEVARIEERAARIAAQRAIFARVEEQIANKEAEVRKRWRNPQQRRWA